MVVVVAAVVAGIGAYAVWAQPADRGGMMGGGMGGGMMGGGMGRGMMMQQGPPGGMPCPMCGMMMGSMMQKTMVATDEGGVIMAMGDKLVKYDRNLNKVKETTLDFDVAQMHEKMQKMMQNCPMMKQQMGGQNSQGQ